MLFVCELTLLSIFIPMLPSWQFCLSIARLIHKEHGASSAHTRCVVAIASIDIPGAHIVSFHHISIAVPLQHSASVHWRRAKTRRRTSRTGKKKEKMKRAPSFPAPHKVHRRSTTAQQHRQCWKKLQSFISFISSQLNFQFPYETHSCTQKSHAIFESHTARKTNEGKRVPTPTADCTLDNTRTRTQWQTQDAARALQRFLYVYMWQQRKQRETMSTHRKENKFRICTDVRVWRFNNAQSVNASTQKKQFISRIFSITCAKVNDDVVAASATVLHPPCSTSASAASSSRCFYCCLSSRRPPIPGDPSTQKSKEFHHFITHNRFYGGLSSASAASRIS